MNQAEGGLQFGKLTLNMGLVIPNCFPLAALNNMQKVGFNFGKYFTELGGRAGDDIAG